MKLRKALYPPLRKLLETERGQLEDEGRDEDADTVSSLIRRLKQAEKVDAEAALFTREELEAVAALAFNHVTLKTITPVFIKLESEIGEDLDNEFPFYLDDFELLRVDDEYSFNVLGHWSGTSPKDSLVYASPHTTDWETGIDESGLNVQLLLLLYLAFLEDPTKPKKAYLIAPKTSPSRKSALAIMQLVSIARHQVVHIPKLPTTRVILDRSIDQLDVKKKYEQFGESIIVLSELLNARDVLNRFLFLYHLLENFTYRYPLQEMIGDDRFTIRSFRDLNRRVEEHGEKALTNLLKEIFWDYTIQGEADDFRSKVMDIRNTFLNKPAAFVTKVDYLLNKIGPAWKLSDNHFGVDRYAQIIYRTRNAIVHNKETEFHLSHFNLSDPVAEFVESFLLEPLLAASFDLICSRDDNLWYEKRSLRLY